MKLPAFQFYPGDWLRDSVAGCSLAAQGLWLRVMFLAHDSERYGYLSINGVAMPRDFIARKVGCSLDEFDTLLIELDRAGVPGRTPEGIIFSRRMVRDAKERQQAGQRKKNQREREKCHGGVTLPSQRSSSSTSSSTSEEGEAPPDSLRGETKYRPLDLSRLKKGTTAHEITVKDRLAAIELVRQEIINATGPPKREANSRLTPQWQAIWDGLKTEKLNLIHWKAGLTNTVK